MRALLLLLMLAGPAAAQVPVCNGLREGMTACFDGRLCRCRFEQAGIMTERPDGHRWDCGALRPDCRPNEPDYALAQYRAADLLGWIEGRRSPSRRRPSALHL
jgi:hypothetical protein